MCRFLPQTFNQLEKLEVPKEEPKPVVVQPSPSKKKKAGKKTKKELE